MTYTTNSLHQADLQVFKGGNKARLVARCYQACLDFDARPDADPKVGKLAYCGYHEFRAAYIKKTFTKLHEIFDQVLPEEYRAKI